MDGDSLFNELKESVKQCRKKIRRKQMKDDNLLGTNVTWDVIWEEVRKGVDTWKLTSQLQPHLKYWFLLLEEFPAERPKEESEYVPGTPYDSNSLLIVQPGDLWFGCTQMDCRNTAPLEDVSRSSESCVMSIESSGHATNVQVSTPSSNSDDPDFDEHKVPASSMVSDECVFPQTKPWWSYMTMSPDGAEPPTNEREREPRGGSRQHGRAEEQGKEAHWRPPRDASPNRSSYFSRAQQMVKVRPAGHMGRRSKPKARVKFNPNPGVSSHQISKGIKMQRESTTRKRPPRPSKPDQITKLKARRKRCGQSELPQDSTAKPKITFPPKDYTYERGDWVVHAIMSSSASPNDLKQALKDRGYELKYILKRGCTIPNKWICSMVASADRTHILTSENIWLKGWEVDFVCNEEDIASFLVE
jgi:hypothetical protein